MSRSIELTDDEIEAIEDAISELIPSPTLTALKAKLIRAEAEAPVTEAAPAAAPVQHEDAAEERGSEG